MYKEFYEKVIGFDKYIEIRCFRKDGMIFSKYFGNWKDLAIFVRENKEKYNLYCGINPRFEKGRKNVSVAYLKNIIFDLESKFTKPKLFINDDQIEYSEYCTKLLKTINWISNYLYEKYNLKINSVVISGRGMHIYITLNDKLSVEEYKQKYSRWYKEVCDYINKNNPYKEEIKVDSMCSDFVRILGSPGSVNIKYPEKPLRRIIYFDLKTDNKIKDILDKQKTCVISKSQKPTKRFKYNEKTIFESPEFKIFEYKPLEGTNINNRLRLALKLLMARDRLTNYDEVAQRIADLGSPYKEMSFVENEYPDYKYNESILNNYILDNFEWAVDVGFKLPYELKEEKKIKNYFKYILEEDVIFVDNDVLEINNINDLIKEISKFNSSYQNIDNNNIIFYTKALKSNLYKKIKNNKLKSFIEQNNLFERLKYIVGK